MDLERRFCIHGLHRWPWRRVFLWAANAAGRERFYLYGPSKSGALRTSQNWRFTGLPNLVLCGPPMQVRHGGENVKKGRQFFNCRPQIIVCECTLLEHSSIPFKVFECTFCYLCPVFHGLSLPRFYGAAISHLVVFLHADGDVFAVDVPCFAVAVHLAGDDIGCHDVCEKHLLLF